MLTVEGIAGIAHEVNRVYCKFLGDNSQVEWDDAPEWQKESAVAGVKAILNWEVGSPADSHENWLRQKLLEGWRYGLVKDADAKEHPCMLIYKDLPKEQKVKDTIFFSLVAGLVDFIPDPVEELDTPSEGVGI